MPENQKKRDDKLSGYLSRTYIPCLLKDHKAIILKHGDNPALMVLKRVTAVYEEKSILPTLIGEFRDMATNVTHVFRGVTFSDPEKGDYTAWRSCEDERIVLRGASVEASSSLSPESVSFISPELSV